MSKFLAPRTQGSMAIGVCDRCNEKVYLDTMRPDGNSPGLRVCSSPSCWDNKDPWRLPPRKTEKISLQYPRPDTDIAIDPANVTNLDNEAQP